MLGWFIGPPLKSAALILSVIAITKGRTGGGLALSPFPLTLESTTFVTAPLVATLPAE